jgi:hypothetical protein
MASDYQTCPPAALDWPGQPRPPQAAPADPVADRLAIIVDRSRRRAPMRRALRRVGREIAHWLDRLAAPVPPGRESEALPPVIRFPFF